MLVLTRKTGQSIVLNDNIEITILEVKGDAVRIGVDAPKNVTIYRREIYEEIKRENLKTANESSLEDISNAISMLKAFKVPSDNYHIFDKSGSKKKDDK